MEVSIFNKRMGIIFIVVICAFLSGCINSQDRLYQEVSEKIASMDSKCLVPKKAPMTAVEGRVTEINEGKTIFIDYLNKDGFRIAQITCDTNGNSLNELYDRFPKFMEKKDLQGREALVFKDNATNSVYFNEGEMIVSVQVFFMRRSEVEKYIIENIFD